MQQPRPPVFYSRWHALILLALGAVLAAINGCVYLAAGKQYRAIWLLVPLLVLVGLAGLYDPRVLPVVTARGLANPWWAVVVAVLCFAVGSAAGIGWAYYLR